MEAKSITAKILETSVLIPNNKAGVLKINAFLKIKGEMKYDSTGQCKGNAAKQQTSNLSEIDKKIQENSTETIKPTSTSFLQVSSLFLNNIKQFKRTKLEELQKHLTTTNIKLNEFIAKVYLNQEEEILNSKSTTQVDKKLKFEHTFNIFTADFHTLMAEFDFHFHESLWDGNTAYIKLNQSVYWMDHHSWNSKMINETCEADNWTNQIRLMFRNKHNSKTISFTFGIALDRNHIVQRASNLKDCLHSKALDSNNTNEIISFALRNVNMK